MENIKVKVILLYEDLEIFLKSDDEYIKDIGNEF